MSETQSVQNMLIAASDAAYQKFQASLLPTLPPQTILGVRIPLVRQYAKQLAGTAEAAHFLSDLPHRYYDENNLHAALLEHIKDFDRALEAVERFLPYIDNWATCDSFCPKCLRQNQQRLFEAIRRWLRSNHPYTVRFALVRLTAWYLDDATFTPEILTLAAAAADSADYYVRMGTAWFFSIALIKQYEHTLPYLTKHHLPVWVHNKAIQKAIESNRPNPATKAHLKTLKHPATRAEGDLL